MLAMRSWMTLPSAQTQLLPAKSQPADIPVSHLDMLVQRWLSPRLKTPQLAWVAGSAAVASVRQQPVLECALLKSKIRREVQLPQFNFPPAPLPLQPTGSGLQTVVITVTTLQASAFTTANNWVCGDKRLFSC